VSVSVHRAGDAEATSIDFMATAAIETALEVDLLVEGGILAYILRRSAP
jgi:hypothetical protein